jgi:hypothetical protein
MIEVLVEIAPASALRRSARASFDARQHAPVL